MVSKSPELLDMLDRYKTGIGWGSHCMIPAAKTRVRAIALDGIAPSNEHLSTGAYPLSIKLRFVHRKGAPGAAARRFLAFVASDQGRAVLRSKGLILAAAD